MATRRTAAAKAPGAASKKPAASKKTAASRTVSAKKAPSTKRAPEEAREVSDEADDESEGHEAEGHEAERDDGHEARGDGDRDSHDGQANDEDEPLVEAAGELVDGDDDIAPFDEEVAAPPRTRAERTPESTDDAAALSRRDPLQAYLREVQRHPLLTPEEEHELALRYSTTQDVAAAARLVTANLRLVVKIAYEYRRAYRNIMDLIQEGNIGLMQAVKKYDPNRGVKLSSYSAWWIRAYILRFIINNWRLVKLGTTQAQRKLFFNLNKEKARLSAMGVDPTPTEIAASLGVDEQDAIDMDRRLSSGEMSLDAPVGDNEGRAVSRIELFPSSGLSPDTMVADEQVQSILRTKLAEFRTTLKGKDIEIFDRRLLAEDPLTLQELGDHFGVSRERVRQIEARLTTNLRNFLQSSLGDAVEQG